MTSLRKFFASSFGSALTGGLVVAIAGWIAIGAGWIEADDGDDGGSAPVIPTEPLAGSGSGGGGEGGGLSVGEIY